MNMERLHQIVRTLASGDAVSESVEVLEGLSEAEDAAVRDLSRRLHAAGGFAALAPVSGTAMWMAAPRVDEAR